MRSFIVLLTQRGQNCTRLPLHFTNLAVAFFVGFSDSLLHSLAPNCSTPSLSSLAVYTANNESNVRVCMVGNEATTSRSNPKACREDPHDGVQCAYASRSMQRHKHFQKKASFLQSMTTQKLLTFKLALNLRFNAALLYVYFAELNLHHDYSMQTS